MFIILVYDVNIKRVGKIRKICRKYLHTVQRSVFEGDLTQHELEKLKGELFTHIDSQIDSVCIYQFESRKYAYKQQLGMIEVQDNII